MQKHKITKQELEEKEVMEAMDRGYLQGRLRRLIGEMATADLRLLYNQLMDIRKPTAEQLVEEVIREQK